MITLASGVSYTDVQFIGLPGIREPLGDGYFTIPENHACLALAVRLSHPAHRVLQHVRNLDVSHLNR